MKNIIVPANYWRTLEYRIVFEELDASRSDRILDIGSPKLLSLYLADRVGAEVFSTDIERYFIQDYDTFRRMRTIPEERYHTVEADGRSLQFEDESFTKIFSISVLEHIPGSGDTECMEEIARTLKTGG
ncbi:MAG: class I SAM-dependent methyltransferase, partial [Bacteroidetes bacterium]|nr:class I SAM-dependent methyltransferase [Bacteroidota bacterium]